MRRWVCVLCDVVKDVELLTTRKPQTRCFLKFQLCQRSRGKMTPRSSAVCRRVYKPLILDAVFSESRNCWIHPHSTCVLSAPTGRPYYSEQIPAIASKMKKIWCSCLSINYWWSPRGTWRQPLHQSREMRAEKIQNSSRYHSVKRFLKC